MQSSKDVARRAGVSQATVSRVLNNPELVKPGTRDKVMRAMEELGYYPNLLARSLVTNSTRTIALVSGALTNHFFAETADSIIHATKQRGYKSIAYFEDEDGVPDFFDAVMGYKVDGLLLSLIRLDDPILPAIEKSGIPCVFFNRRPRSGGNYVTLDNRKSAELAVRHLTGLGHRRIAYISGATDISTFYERRLGFEVALNDAGIIPDHGLMYFGQLSGGRVEEVAAEFASMARRPTAIVCATDTIAMACMNELMALGLRIPHDISLVGMDNVSLDAHRAIQLTTVGTDGVNMGELAAELLVDLIEAPEAADMPVQVTLEPKLYARGTTAPPGVPS